MAIEVFNRYEKKYILTQKQYEVLTESLPAYMEADSHSRDGGFYSICNIYYDTVTDELIRKSLEKPVYKEKVRVRSYGTPDDGSETFVEIKKKYKGIVNKRRVTMNLKEAMAYMETGAVPDRPSLNRQVLKELNYMREYYRLVPKAYISYDRRAYFGIADPDFRITFDTNIQTRRTDLRLDHGAYGTQLLEDGQWIMEIKINKTIPEWFVKLLSENRIYPGSFSKYGTAYLRYIENLREKGEKTACLNQSSVQRTQPSRREAPCSVWQRQSFSA